MKRTFIVSAGLLFTLGCSSGGPENVWATVTEQQSVDVRRIETSLWGGASAGPSPDGRALAGAAGGYGDGFFIEEIGGARRLLETGAGATPGDTPRFSRDGRWVAYNWYPDAPIGAGLELRVIPVDGGAPRVVLPGRGLGYPVPGDWSPDGRSLAAVDFGEDGTIRILLVPTDGGEPLLVRALDWRAPNAVSFSPDGRFLAFDVPTSDESMERDLAVYDLQTGRERRILDHPANDLLLGWSPTGEIYFSSERAGLPAVWRARMAYGRAAGEPELVKRDFLRATPVGFTSAGDFFYTIRRPRGAAFYSVALDAAGLPVGPARALTSLGDVEGNLAVSDDGRLISYISSDNLGARRDNEKGGVLLKVVAVDGGQTREFPLPLRMRSGGPGLWMPDASGLIFRGNEEGRYGVFRLDFESVGVERLISGGGLDGAAGRFRFDLTPDGRNIVYIEDTLGLSRLVVRSLASGSERTLVSGSGGSGPNVSPKVSPDGMWVAFYRFGVEGVGGVIPEGQVYDLMLVPLAGGEPRRITSTRGGGFAWASDSKALLFGGPEITRVPVDGGPAVGLGIRGGVLWVDPAGRTLTYSVGEGGGPDQLWLMGTGALR